MPINREVLPTQSALFVCTQHFEKADKILIPCEVRVLQVSKQHSRSASEVDKRSEKE